MNDESSRIARKLTAAEAALRIVAAPERGLVSAGAYYTGKAGMRAYGVRLIIRRAVSALSPWDVRYPKPERNSIVREGTTPQKPRVALAFVGAPPSARSF